MEQKDKLTLDTRTTEDLRAQIAVLAKSYTPEWRFDPENPDVGSTIALIFANQMAGNIRRLNQAIEKYHTEFVNLLGISLLPAYPAAGIVTARVLRETVAGVNLPRGTKLVGQVAQGGDEPLVFETMSDLYVTSARLSEILSISGHFGKIIPMRGALEKTKFFSAPASDQQNLPAEEPEELAVQTQPVSLFDFSQEGVEQNLLMLYHRNVFDIADGATICVQLTAPDGTPIRQKWSDPKQYEWSYFDGEQLVPFEVTPGDAGSVCLRRSGESTKITLDGEAYDLVCLRMLQPPKHVTQLCDLRISSACEQRAPVFVSRNDMDVEVGRFMPFGESASLFDECYIGHEQIFNQQGAAITVSFQLSYAKKLVTFTPQQEAEELKIIKRKPRTVLFDTVNTAVQQVSMEYYNGVGWRRLECEQDYSNLFDGQTAGDITLRFRCPEDWRPMAVSGYETRSIRLRVVRADNCYLQPCIHNMPVIENLRLSYSYDGNWRTPQRLRRICGTRLEDLTRPLQEGKPMTVFSPLPWEGNGLYLGFDAPIEGAPVSLLFHITESLRAENVPITFEYSVLNGWKPLKVIDGTKNLTDAGTIVFMPPSDFAPANVEGLHRYWIRLMDESRAYNDPARYHAVISSIELNAVAIQNIQTRDEEAFYIQSAMPNMRFKLSAENILSAEVFVSELGRLSQSAMQQMLRDCPDDVRVEYDFLGGIRTFFVRWQEVENFDDSKPDSRHYMIDRMNNRIVFGDGVRVMIPAAQNGVAFTVQVKCCKGTKGNLPAGAVNTLFDGMLYLEQISNPIPTYAGSNIESIQSAHRRGANVVSGRNRLVSELDYKREIAAFSDSIVKVRCVAGKDLEGRKIPGLLTVAVLMRDYIDGAHSFNSIRERLYQRLLERSEATLDASCLILSEPVFVEVSLEVWVQANDATRSFDVQNLILVSIGKFLDPLGENDWEIGDLPSEAQLRRMLMSLRASMRVTRFIATARYVDRRGVHETTLGALPHNPLAIAVNGKHKVYIELT